MAWNACLLFLLVASMSSALAELSETDEDDGDLPDVCTTCSCSEDFARVDCTGRRLDQLPDGLTQEVTQLILANNEFTMWPNLQHLYNLQTLDFSGNRLTTLPTEALKNLTNLEYLNLAENAFTTWTDINPNTILLEAEKLIELNLSSNDFQRFGNLTDEEFLMSTSLQKLVVERCGITSIQDRSPISGLTNIKSLILRNNPLRKLEGLSSPTLHYLDVSHCSLVFVGPDELSYLPSLHKLVMSHNYRLLVSSPFGNLSSDSLREFDISYCNVIKIAMTGFPNLRKLNMSTNSIVAINENEFYNNTKLEVLDLSYNSISSFHQFSFKGLISLKHLNLTGNKIQKIDEDLFLRSTIILQSLSLSRNYFTEVIHIESGTLQYLDLSMCEISSIDQDALVGLWSLNVLNLSRNLLGWIPDDLSSNTLTVLDLSDNRLSIITNGTFHKLPRLTTLSVSGNRFSTIWSRQFFDSNQYLKKIDLNDNTWRCECADADMFEFFEFVTLEPSKLEDAGDLVCHSPGNVSGVTWQDACDSTWFPTTTTASNDAIILFLTIVAVFIGLCALIVVAVRRLMAVKLEALRQERERQAEEARERLRRLRMQSEQQAQCNAPDPRDLISPPSYAEALLMERPVSVHSLQGIGETKRKKTRRRAKSSGDVTSEPDYETESEARPRGRKRRARRCGSHELKEMERSPRSPRRKLSADDVATDPADTTIQVDTDSDVEVAQLMANYRANGAQTHRVRESDF